MTAPTTYKGTEARFDRATDYRIATRHDWHACYDQHDVFAGYEMPSEKDPCGVYFVSQHGCTCKGFEVRGYCKHFDAYGQAEQMEREATAAVASAPRFGCLECGRELPVGGAICQACDDLADDLDALYPGVAA